MKERLFPEQSSTDLEAESDRTIVFNASKNDVFKLTDNLKTLQRKLKSTTKVSINRELINEENETIKEANVLVLPGPRLVFGPQEIEHIHALVKSGRSLLVLLAEGGEVNLNTNINEVLDKYGISVNNDCVIRTQYYKYFLPKQCFLNDTSIAGIFGSDDASEGTRSFVYPFGATLTVTKPAVIALTSGEACYPANRPLCAVYIDKETNGRVVVLGSGHMFTDKYLELEHNDAFCDKLFQFLTEDNITNEIYGDDFDIWDYHLVPDVPMLADKPQLCLVDSANTVSVDFTKLFNAKLYSLNTDFVPEIIKGYEDMNVKHAALTLIVPHFEEASPQLQLAVFPPSFSELPPPALELFDLEEEFSAEETQLAQITNRHLNSNNQQESPEDLEQYIKEAAEVLGIGQTEYPAIRLIYESALLVSNFKMASVNDNDLDERPESKKELHQNDLWVNEPTQPDVDSDLESIGPSDFL